MKWRALALLVVVTVAGCGGGGDGSNDKEKATTTAPPKKLEGSATRQKVVKTLSLEKQGDHYTFSGGGGCKILDVAGGTAQVKKLQKSADNPRNVIANKRNTAAVELGGNISYACAVQSSLRLRAIP